MMEITKEFYPLAGTKKYKAIRNGKEYSCYINPFNGNSVCTGNGLTENCKDITHTKIGMEIILACGKL